MKTARKALLICFIVLVLEIVIIFALFPEFKRQLLGADWGWALSHAIGYVALLLLIIGGLFLLMVPFIKADERRKERDSRIVKTRLVSSDRIRSRTTGVGVYLGAGVSVGSSRTRHDDEHTYFVYYENGEVKTERVIAGSARDRFLMDKIEK